MPLIIALILAFVAGLGLQRLIGGKVGTPVKPSDYGRIWSGWVVWAATFYLLTGFLMRFDAESFLTLIVVMPFYGGVAFAAGCGYGKIFRARSPDMKANGQETSVEHSNLMTLPDGAVQDTQTERKAPVNQTKIQPAKPNSSLGTQATTNPTVMTRKASSTFAPSSAKHPQPVGQETMKEFYEKTWDEVESGNTVKGIWAQAFAECDGDLVKTKARYINHRVTELARQAEDQKRKEEEAARQAELAEIRRLKEAARQDEEKKKKSDESTIEFSPPEPERPLFTNPFGMTFKHISAGRFMMGSPEDEPGRDRDETAHLVALTMDYYMQTTEVTQGQWEKIMNSNPSHFSNCGGDCPVEGVSWNDVQTFIRKLNNMDRRVMYRLPTEAEWEYAARAGSTTQFCFGDDVGWLEYYAWYETNSKDRIHPVGLKKPNEWGLYDMHGNVWEWCSDWYGDYVSGSLIDPSGPPSGTNRVLRGGSWYSSARLCRSASRLKSAPDNRYGSHGFRLVLSNHP